MLRPLHCHDRYARGLTDAAWDWRVQSGHFMAGLRRPCLGAAAARCDEDKRGRAIALSDNVRFRETERADVRVYVGATDGPCICAGDAGGVADEGCAAHLERDTNTPKCVDTGMGAEDRRACGVFVEPASRGPCARAW